MARSTLACTRGDMSPISSRNSVPPSAAANRPSLAAAAPDSAERLRRDAPLAPADRSTFYGGDARGYTDYPALSSG